MSCGDGGRCVAWCDYNGVLVHVGSGGNSKESTRWKGSHSFLTSSSLKRHGVHLSSAGRIRPLVLQTADLIKDSNVFINTNSLLLLQRGKHCSDGISGTPWGSRGSRPMRCQDSDLNQAAHSGVILQGLMGFWRHICVSLLLCLVPGHCNVWASLGVQRGW